MASLKNLYISQLKDLYDAELRLVEALPKVSQAASSQELKSAIDGHLEETRGQVKRLETIFANHGIEPKRETCKAMKGLLEEADKEMKEWDEESVKDAAIIAGAQRVEHYEMAGYGSAKAFAQMLGFSDDVNLLDETLNEEKAADIKLSDVALQSINVDALLATDEDEEEAEATEKKTLKAPLRKTAPKTKQSPARSRA